jgi:MFS family permease
MTETGYPTRLGGPEGALHPEAEGEIPVSHQWKPRAIGTAVLIAVCLYISGLLVILTPLPLVYVSATYGRKNGFIAAAIAFFLVSGLYFGALFLSPAGGQTALQAIPLPGLSLLSHFPSLAIEIVGGGYFLFFMVIALILGEAVRYHWGIMRGGGRALVAGLALSCGIALILQLSGVVHIITSVRGYLEFIVGEVARLQEAAGVSSAQTALLTEHGPEVAAFIFSIIPSLIFVFALVSVAMNLLLSRRFIRLPHLFSGHAWDVAAFRIPDVFVWAIIGSALIFFGGRYTLHKGWVEYIGVNVLIALAAVYFFQGLAITAFFLRRLKFPLFRILSYVMIILFFQTVGILIMGIGVADIWVNFRHRIIANR